MGVCYSQQEQWQAYGSGYRDRKKRRKHRAQNQVIYQQKTIFEESFNSGVQKSFLEQSHPIHSIFSEDSIAFGSVVDLNQSQQQALQKSLQTLNSDAQIHKESQLFSLCNLKSKNFLHTHRIRLPDQCRENQVSCCPYNSTHMIQYDLWKLVKSQNQQRYYLYHPFTQRFLNFKKGEIVCSEDKMEWEVKSFGVRRNGGYIKIKCNQGQLCMTHDRALLQNHRKLILCTSKHIGHIWQVKFGECIDMSESNH